MVNVFNRKLIYSGSDAEDAARVWSTLKAAGVPYSMQTKGVQSRLVGGVHEQRVRVGVGIGGDGDAAGVMAGVDDAHGDFATVGDEDAP